MGLAPHPEGGHYRRVWRDPGGRGSAVWELAPPGWQPGGVSYNGDRVAVVARTKPTTRPAPLRATLAAGRQASPKAGPLPGPAPGPATLAVDVGGTGIKASVLDPTGQMEHERVRVATPYPLSPQVLIATIADILPSLPAFDRISVGFPGMVREGRILTAPHFLSAKGADGTPEPDLVAAWGAFDLQEALTTAFGRLAKVANDADLQGAAVVTGAGLELVVTLGTGIGSGLFYRGRLCPHLELAQHPFRGHKTYNEYLGDAARRKAGPAKWNERVRLMIATLRTLLAWDHLYLGGGNAVRVKGDLPAGVSIVDNDAGILGGIRLWDQEPL